MKKIKVSILGSTGSIGTQTLDVISHHREKFDVVNLTCAHNFKLLEKQKKLFNVKPKSSKLEPDIIVNAISGKAGLKPTIDALKKGQVVALANKESIVLDGKNLKALENKFANKGAKILPLDSEHHAVLRILESQGLTKFDPKKVKKIIITCSGGPFFGFTKAKLKNATAKDALKNPNWKMGKKILIESAFLINKGYELIEAHHLFDAPLKNLDAIIDRKSYIHAIVEFKNPKQVVALAYKPDMRTVIEDTLLKFHAEANGKPYKNKKLKLLDSKAIKAYPFKKIDHKTFPAIKEILKAYKQGEIKTIFAKYEKFVRGKTAGS